MFQSEKAGGETPKPPRPGHRPWLIKAFGHGTREAHPHAEASRGPHPAPREPRTSRRFADPGHAMPSRRSGRRNAPAHRAIKPVNSAQAPTAHLGRALTPGVPGSPRTQAKRPARSHWRFLPMPKAARIRPPAARQPMRHTPASATRTTRSPKPGPPTPWATAHVRGAQTRNPPAPPLAEHHDDQHAGRPIPASPRPSLPPGRPGQALSPTPGVPGGRPPGQTQR